MNMKRGLFRIWVILSVVFITIVLTYSFNSIKSEFETVSLIKEMDKSATMLVPVERRKARGEENKDYSCSNPFLIPDTQFKSDTCLYELPKFRKLYPEYNDVTDKKLATDLYKEAGRPTKEFSPWTKLMQTLIIAIGVPLAMLIFGRALLWSIDGFKSESSKR
jgi:hypothetical protein